MKKLLSILVICFVVLLALASCDNLGNKPSETPDSHTHQFGEWKTTTNPTCTEDGVETRYCNCGEKQTESIPAKGHTEVVVEAVAPTCAETGLTEGKKCSDCDTVFIAQNVVDKLPHTEETLPAVDPTCTDIGFTEGKKCSACDEILIAQVEIIKLSHTYSSDLDATCEVCGFTRDVNCDHTDVATYPAKDATCTEAGYTESVVCNICQEILLPQTVVDAKGHTEVVDAGHAATCTAVGMTDGKHCSVCNTTLVAQGYIKALGHNESDWIVEKIPTDTEEGYKYKTCYRCHEKVVEKVIAALTDIGLEYTINGSECIITGIGTFADSVLVIPEYIKGYKVTAIANRAFYNCKTLTEITIPETVTSIGTQIFYKADNLSTIYYNSTYSSGENNFLNTASIKKVVFGGKYVPSDIIRDCVNITQIEIIDSVIEIHSSAFSGCSAVKEVVIPDSVVDIGGYVFNNCTSLVSVELSKSIKNIDYMAFAGCISLVEIEIPDGVLGIDDYVFTGCSSLTSVVIPNSVTRIGGYAFYDCSSLTDICIPNSVISLGGGAFRGCCAISSIVIPDSIAVINNQMFLDCTSLKIIVIPDSVTSVGDNVFSGCYSLKEVYYSGSDSQWHKIFIGYSNETLTSATIHYNHIP